MMIKKNLGLLAGSILATSSANAAITAANFATDTGVGDPGVDSSVILVLAGTDNGAFVIETGIDAGQLAAGMGFSAIDLTAASAALGGDITQWALLGVLGGTDSMAYNTSVGYFSGGMGVVYGAAAAGSATLSNTVSTTSAVNSYISLVSAGGFFADDTGGDLDETGLGVTFLGIGTMNSAAAAGVFVQATTTGFGATVNTFQVPVSGLSFGGGSFTGGSEVPVPAAAWLFGSALLGLGVLRRKS